MVSLYLARGDIELARAFVDEIMTGRFQPATPTFLTPARRARGELVSCFLLRIEDNMESIARGINSALQLSKRGGGVALQLFLDDETGNLLTLEMFCGSQEQADRLARNFKAEPERIYNEVLSALLSSGEDGKDEREE